MRMSAATAALWLAMWMATGVDGSSSYYAGTENPLVRLGAQRVLKTIGYPDWFQYPSIPKDVRQQLVDSFTTREYLASFDKSVRDAPFTKSFDALQLAIDLLGAYGGNGDSLRPAVTKKEINDALRKQVVPSLIQPRKGFELDSPSTNETVSGQEDDYGGMNGDDIRNLDRYISGLARHYNLPTGYRPPSSFMSPKERDAWQRNQDKMERETLAPPAQEPITQKTPAKRSTEQCWATYRACSASCNSISRNGNYSNASILAEARCSQDCGDVLHACQRQ